MSVGEGKKQVCPVSPPRRGRLGSLTPETVLICADSSSKPCVESGVDMQVLSCFCCSRPSRPRKTSEVRVMCSNGLKAAVEQLVPADQRESGQRVEE